MISNIKDNRENWAKSEGLDFVVEPSWTDNDLPEATQHDGDDPRINFYYAELIKATIEEGIAWGNSFECPVTLFIYNNLYEVDPPHKTKTIDYAAPVFTD